MDITVMKAAPLSGRCTLHEIIKSKDGKPVMDKSFYGPKVPKFTLSTDDNRKRINVEALNKEEMNDARLYNCFYLGVAEGLWNSDSAEFKMNILKYLPLMKKHQELVSSAELHKDENFSFEVTVKEVDKLEDMFNEELKKISRAVSIVVLYENENDIYPMRVGSVYKDYVKRKAEGETDLIEPTVVVLLLKYLSMSDEGAAGASQYVGHYAFIRKPEKVLSTVYKFKTPQTPSPCSSDSDDTDFQKKRKKEQLVNKDVVLCYNCFTFHRKTSYDNHVMWCHERKGQKVVMPKPGERTKFKSGLAQNMAAFCIFYDFEAAGKQPSEEAQACSCTNEERRRRREGISDSEKAEWACIAHDLGPSAARRLLPKICPHKTDTLNEHEVYSVSMIIVDRENKVREEFTYSGTDAVQVFLHKILAWESYYLNSVAKRNAMGMNLSPQEKKIALSLIRHSPPSERICHICDHIVKREDVALDHCHLTGKIIGVAHKRCNLMRTEQMRIAAFAHNFVSKLISLFLFLYHIHFSFF